MNEAIFRAVNEQIESLNEVFAPLTQDVVVVCECGESSCIEQFRLTLDEYAAVRADPTLFAVVPGHETADVETVVLENERYAVVKKRPGEPADVARATE